MNDEEKQVILCCAKLLLEIKPLLESISKGLEAISDEMESNYSMMYNVGMSMDKLRETIEGSKNGNYEKSEGYDYE